MEKYCGHARTSGIVLGMILSSKVQWNGNVGTIRSWLRWKYIQTNNHDILNKCLVSYRMSSFT